MNLQDVRLARLANERLIGEPFKRPEDVVVWLGAVQSQDYPGAKWALGQRTKSCLDIDVDQAFNDGKILRTHILRPTWHFVVPEDIKWMQMLTAPRVHALNAYYYRKLGLDTATLQKGHEVLANVLQGGKQLTRSEIKQALEDAGMGDIGLRSGYLIGHAELEALICSGAMRGKQHTYALVAERAPQAKTLTRDEALAELTTRYFTSHGPAQIQDFAWWSSLTVADIKKGIELAKPKLQQETVEGKVFYFAQLATPKIKSPLVQLLPNYDESLIAYKDHSPSMMPGLKVSIGVRDVVFANHIITLDGQVIGGWRRIQAKNQVEVQTKLLVPLDKTQKASLAAAAHALETFLKVPVKLS